MPRSSNRDDFFQTTYEQALYFRIQQKSNGYRRASLDEQKRREIKSRNEHGKPIKLQSKILAVMAGTPNSGAVFVAQSGGTVRKVMLEVGAQCHQSVSQ